MIGPLSVFSCNILRTITKGHFPFLSDMKHSLMIKYLAKECDEVLIQYKDISFELPSVPSIPKIVWTLWYTEENLPDMVKKSLARIKKSLEAIGYDVRILNKSNISTYVDMSDVQFFLDNEMISIQYFSDILRCRLLYKYGGFWIDSTIAILNPDYIETIHNENSFFTLRNDVKGNWYVLGNRWTSFFWATCKYNPFFSFMDKAMTLFVKKHKGVFEYLHFDYTIAMGYTYVPFIRKELDMMLSFHPTAVSGLMSIINEPFDEEIFEDYLKNAPIQKLTYKKQKPEILTETGDITFWGYLLNSWK